MKTVLNHPFAKACSHKISNGKPFQMLIHLKNAASFLFIKGYSFWIRLSLNTFYWKRFRLYLKELPESELVTCKSLSFLFSQFKNFLDSFW